jgi:hypothetical protein
MRLSAAAYGELTARWGPFTEWIGSERRHVQRRASTDDGDCLWVHPTHTTVGSALRLIGERLGEARARPVRGLIVVPHDEHAAWWRLTRHLAVVGRLPAGGRHLEANVLGEWRLVVARREALVLAFPRAEAEATGRSERNAMAAALQEGAQPEGGAEQLWRAARASADEAAAARRHVLPAACTEGRRQRPLVRTLQQMGAVQRCHYRGTECAGCWQQMRRGERVRSAGGGLVHAQGGCVEAAIRAATASGRRPRSVATGLRVQGQDMEDARAYATWAAMEREFALGGSAGGARLLLPRHSRLRFLELIEWMAISERRCALLPTVMRATGIYTQQTQLNDWGADAGVRARCDELMAGAAEASRV